MVYSHGIFPCILKSEIKRELNISQCLFQMHTSLHDEL